MDQRFITLVSFANNRLILLRKALETSKRHVSAQHKIGTVNANNLSLNRSNFADLPRMATDEVLY